jgi:hypothetical protein
MLQQEAKIKAESMRDGGKVKNDCIEFIKNSESLLSNGYYLHIENLNVYVNAGDKTIPKIKSLILITYNSGGQSNLKAIDTINSSALAQEVSKLIGGNLNVARIIVSEQMIHSKRISLNVLKGLENENIIIADRDRIVCTNLTANYEDGGSVGFENKLFDELAQHDAPSFADGGEIEDKFVNTKKLIEELKKHSFYQRGIVSVSKDGQKYRYDHYKLKYANSSNWLVKLFEKAAEENTGKPYYTQFHHTDHFSFNYDRPTYKGVPNGRMSMSELILM